MNNTFKEVLSIAAAVLMMVALAIVLVPYFLVMATSAALQAFFKIWLEDKSKRPVDSQRKAVADSKL